MITNNDNLFDSAAPHLEEYLQHLKAQREQLDAKIREVERLLSEAGHRSNVERRGKRPRQPKGANRALLLKWFYEHPTTSVGQAEIADKTGIRSSSARAVLERLTKDGILERDGSQWRLKQQPEKPSNAIF